MKSKTGMKILNVCVIIFLVFGTLMIGTTPVSADLSGSASSSATPSDATPTVGDQITVTINIDMSGVASPDDALGGFTGSLDWDPAVLAYNTDSGILAGFTGNVVATDSGAGHITFNGIKTTGTTGNTIILTITFDVAGPGTSALDLEYSAMAAASTFTNLLLVLTVNGGSVTAVVPTLAYIGDIGSITANVAGTSLQIPVGVEGAASGNTILVGFASRGATTYNEPTVTNSGGNIYHLATFAVTYQHGRSYLFYAHVDHTLINGNSITITTSSVASRVAVASLFSGLLDVDPLDQKLANPTGTSTTAQGNNISVGPTATTVQADELLIGLIGTEEATDAGVGTWLNEFIAGPQVKTSGATNEWRVSMGYKIVSSIGEYTAAKTVTNNPYWAANIATFKAGAAIPNEPPEVSDIPDQTIVEGGSFATINLDNYVTDPDNSDSEIVWTYSGNTDLSVSITSRVATITIPGADWNGSEIITFKATDPLGRFDDDSATFTVTSVNDPPVAVDDVAETAIDTQVNIAILGNDTDIDGDTLVVTAVSDPPHGTAAIKGDNTVDYTPDSGYTGSDSFTYDISDGHGGTNSATVNVTINALSPLGLDGAISTVTATTTTGNSINVTHTTGTGTNRLMLVGITANGGTGTLTVSSVTFTPDGGLATNLNEIGNVANQGRRVAIWGLVNPTSGQHGTVVITFSANVSYGLFVGVANFAGVDADDPFEAFSSATGDSGNPTVDLSELDGDELVFDNVFIGAATPPGLTVGAGQTELWNARSGTSSTNDRMRGAASIEEASSSSVTMSWTASDTGYWAIGAVPINPAAVGPTHTLTADVTPSSEYGSITGVSNPYAEGATASITAVANPGYRFVQWTAGDCLGSTNPLCNVIMSSDKSVTADFEVIPTYNLTMAVDPGIGGTTVPAVGVHNYLENTVVNISASPAAGYAFDHWTAGVADPNAASTTVTMNTAKTITAYFTLIPTYTLTAGNDGHGSVTLNPSGGTYLSGTTVTLTPVPEEGYVFDAWTGTNAGDVIDTAGVYTIVMTGNKSVTATFTEVPPGVILDGVVSSNTIASGTTINVTHTTGSGTNRLMLVGISANSYGTARTISTITFTPSGGSVLNLSLVGSVENELGRLAAIYKLVDPPSGVTGIIAVTFSGSVGNGIVVGAANFAGVNLTNPLGNFVSDVGTETKGISIDVPNDFNDLIFDTVFIGAATVPSLTVDSSQTQLWNATAGRVRGTASSKLATTTTTTMNWTVSGGATSYYWAIGAVPIKPAAVGPTHTLTADVTPSSEYGSITGVSNPYAEGATASITAVANPGYRFVQWTAGDCLGSTNPLCNVIMSSDKSVTADFEVIPTYNLTMAVDPGIGGTTVPAVGVHNYLENTVVNISASPAAGYAFDHWTAGVADPNAASTTVTMNTAKTITAYFTLIPTYTLTAGNDGHGSVTLNPSGGTYLSGTTVTLTPVPEEGYVFDAWTGTNAGDVIDTAGVYTIVMTGNKSVTATFVEAPPAVILDGIVSSNTAGSGSSITISHTTGTGANRLMLVGVSWNCGTTDRTISSVTFTPNGGIAVGLAEVLTQLGYNTSNPRYSAIYSLINPPSGQAGTITVTFSGSVSNGIMAGAANFTGVDQTTPLGTPNGANGNTTTPTVDLSGLNGTELIFDNVFLGAGSSTYTLAVGTGQTQLWNPDYVANLRAAASIRQVTGTSATMSWTAATGNYWAIAAVPINPALAISGHTVTFMSNGGSGSMSPQTADIPTALTANAFTRTGYTFSGWNTDAGGGGTAYANSATYDFSADITLYAQWTAAMYTVTFDANGGTTPVPTSKVVTYDAAYGTLATTSRTGYTFNGWFTAASGGSQVTAATIVNTAANHTLYAQWTGLTYTVTFDANGGTTAVPTSKVVTYDAAYGTLATTSRTGYTFNGWFTAASGGSQVTAATIMTTAENHTLYAQWTALTYTVTFDANGGTAPVPTSKVVTYDSTYGTLATTSRTGYILDGWFTAASGGIQVTAATIVTTTENHTLYAQWTELSNPIVTSEAVPSDAAPRVGDTITVSVNIDIAGAALASYTGNLDWDPAILAYHSYSAAPPAGFTGVVNTGQAGTGHITFNGANATGSEGSIVLITITFDVVGPGTSALDLAYDPMSAPAPTFENLLPYLTVTPGQVVVPQPPSHTVTFMSNDGTGSMSPQTANIPTALTLNAFTRTDYTFSHWNTAANNSGTTYANGATYSFAADLTLYAQWIESPDTYSIPLYAGWNLVSFNLHPSNTAIATVLSSINGNYNLVYAWDATGAHSSGGNWVKYDPTGPGYQNSLLELDQTIGFWIHMTAADTLEINGSAPETTEIQLATEAGGWNLVGFSSADSSVLPQALSDNGVGTDFSLVFAYHADDTVDHWKLFDRNAEAWANDLTELAPGWGYWVKVSANHTWSVDY